MSRRAGSRPCGGSRPHASSRDTGRRAPDQGFSILEVLLSVVLLGAVVTGVLGSMGGAVRGADLAEDRSAQIGWLQSAADYLQNSAFTACSGSDGTTAAAAYETLLRSADAPEAPTGWTREQVSVSALQTWNGTSFVNTCTPTSRMQQFTVTVRDVSGRNTTSLTMVKSVFDAAT